MLKRTWPYGTEKRGTVHSVFRFAETDTVVIRGDDGEGYVLIGEKVKATVRDGDYVTYRFVEGGPTGGHWRIVASAEQAVLTTWREHGDGDEPECVFFRLCRACSDRIIEPHPRLYSSMAANEPAIGAMECCRACKYRDGLRCQNPDMKANGGPGVAIRVNQCGWACSRGKGGGCRPIYDGPPQCEGFSNRD